MAKDIGVDELLEEKNKLQENITKAVQQDIEQFYKNTEVPLKNVVISLAADGVTVNYALCNLEL